MNAIPCEAIPIFPAFQLPMQVAVKAKKRFYIFVPAGSACFVLLIPHFFSDVLIFKKKSLTCCIDYNFIVIYAKFSVQFKGYAVVLLFNCEIVMKKETKTY